MTESRAGVKITRKMHAQMLMRANVHVNRQDEKKKCTQVEGSRSANFISPPLPGKKTIGRKRKQQKCRGKQSTKIVHLFTEGDNTSMRVVWKRR